MLLHGILIGIVGGLFLLPVCAAAVEMRTGNRNITGPFSFENLSLYFFIDDGQTTKAEFLTLDEAVNQDKIIVHETGSVGELAIEIKGDKPVFIQAGDIVKGGQQDRVIRFDLIIYPGDGKIPIASFCVESGRWSQREGEDVHKFEQAAKQVVSRELKIAAKVMGSQADVWDEVDNVQDKLAANIGKSVADPSSSSSLQLTLENIDVQEQIEALVMEMTDALDTVENAIGAMYVINGEISGGDMYCDSRLFGQCWPKLIESYAIEALSVKDKFSGQSPPSVNTISAWFEAACRGKQSQEEINDNTTVKTVESKSAYWFETLNSKDNNNRVHVNIIRK